VREGLKEGNFETIIDMARRSPKTLVELLNEPALFGEIIQTTRNPTLRWSSALFLYDIQENLNQEQRAIARDTLVRILMQLASQISAKGIRSTQRRLTTFRPGLDEMEIEETMENIMGKTCPEHGDIIMVDKEPKGRGVVMMLDISNSMQREKLLTAILAIGVLAYRLRGEKYAILTFNNEIDIIKPMDQDMTIEALLDKMLEIRSQGATNIGLALEIGLQQLSKEVASERLGIIATDGWVTKGEDPLDVAPKYSRLNVLQVPLEYGGCIRDVCRAMAKATKGKHVHVKHYHELPRAIMEVLR